MKVTGTYNMKKVVSILLTIAMVFSISSVTCFADTVDVTVTVDFNGEKVEDTENDTDKTDDNTLNGDVNLDGVVDVVDVALIRAHIVKSRDLSLIDDKATTRADVNSDKNVDIIDVVIIRNIIVSK